jgi:hypothetical protein
MDPYGDGTRDGPMPNKRRKVAVKAKEGGTATGSNTVRQQGKVADTSERTTRATAAANRLGKRGAGAGA